MLVVNGSHSWQVQQNVLFIAEDTVCRCKVVLLILCCSYHSMSVAVQESLLHWKMLEPVRDVLKSEDLKLCGRYGVKN